MARRYVVDLVIKVTGDADAKIAKLNHALSHPMLASMFLGGVVYPHLRRRMAQRFAQEGDDVSGPWQQLSAATVQIRQQAGYPGAHPINQRTGEMERYLTGAPPLLTADPAFATLIYPGRSATGEMAEKIQTAQAGGGHKGPADRGHTAPARPVIGVNEKDLFFILGALEQYLKGAVGVR